MEKLSAYVDTIKEYDPDTIVTEGPGEALFLVHRYFDALTGEYMVDEFIVYHVPTRGEVANIIAYGVTERTTPWAEWVEQ